MEQEIPKNLPLSFIPAKSLEDKIEFRNQILAEPKKYRIVDTEAYGYDKGLKVRIRDNVWPRPHEIYNCTTCAKAEPEHPIWKMRDKNRYHVKCKSGCVRGHMNTAGRMEDISGTCPTYRIRDDIRPKFHLEDYVNALTPRR